jgi:hypothetical protein
MMIMKHLLDREEVYEHPDWYLIELFVTECPECHRDTGITHTYPDYTEYHHSPGDFCTVYWTKEFADENYILAPMVVPGYIRD